MWSIQINVIIKKKKPDENIHEIVLGEITEIMEKHLDRKEIDDYVAEVEF